MAGLPDVGANPAGFQAPSGAPVSTCGLEPGLKREGQRTVVGRCKRGAIADVSLMQGAHGALDVARNGQVSYGHLAQIVIQIDGERLGQGPGEALAGLAVLPESMQHHHEMQDYHLESPFGCIGHAPVRIERARACLRHNRAIKGACFLVPVPPQPQPRQHGCVLMV